MITKIVVDVATGQATPVPLTPAEQAAYDAAAAAAPGIEATQMTARASARTLNANVAGALARLRQIQGINPATATPQLLTQAVTDLATSMLQIARILSGQFDGTT